MKRDWLWDRKTTIREAKKILSNPDKYKQEFIALASLLLQRKNDPQEVLKQYLKPLLFCRYWPEIKKKMRMDKWSSSRTTFWQAIYEKLLEKYKKQGITIKKMGETPAVDPLCKAIGEQIRAIRKEEGLSQKELASKLGVSQQLISRIEKGKENVSLLTLKNIAGILAKKVTIFIKEK